ncbi:MAG TPA: carbamoyltransferase N-terminal domain-containing protein, partial [Blastocatellia bacterium]
MNILGISGQESDAAAAIVRDGEVIAAIEEEKLSRIRHVGMNYAGGLPRRAIEFCLERAKISLKDLDYVAYYLEPEKLFHRQIAFYSSRALLAPASKDAFPSYFVESLNELRNRQATRQQIESSLSEKGRFIAVNHHLAHGASAFYSSGFERAAIISAGNRGDMNSTALMTGEGAHLKIISEAEFPNSIGMLYNSVTAFLGFNADSDWHKVMWLAPTGRAEMEGLFADILSVDANGLPS